ncbi:MAG: gamma-glutamyltransferase [Planctomycetes bacterium]|nr:gamma-glutamyltransferase [Planctomycetota bacterium]
MISTVTTAPLFLVLALSAAPGSSRNMVATVHPRATRAGLDVFRAGGNAIDAAVAAALTLGVVDGHNSGIGGGCFVLLRRADGKLFAIDGRETAPAAARADMYLVNGVAKVEWSQTGPLAVAVPGALRAYERAIKEHGRCSLSELLLPAARIADSGFAIDAVYARNIRQSRSAIEKFPETRRILLAPDGDPLREGQILLQPDLAKTYRAIAEKGVDWFYQGPFAESVGEWMTENGGILTAADFARYEAISREPLRSRYREYEIIGFPPPSSGGVHVAQILNTLAPFDLRAVHSQDPAACFHLMAEAMKLAFADRAYWLGDPAFAPVPRGLASPEYGAALARRIDPQRATAVDGHGEPPVAREELFQKHTTHIAAADDEGNWVAITATVNTSFGSKVVVPGTGVFLNNEMDDFSLEPGVPNAFGLVGAEANRVEPGKRPLSSMSPTIVLRDGKPLLTLGAAGGPTIISQVASLLVRRLDLDRDLADAVQDPRFHHQWRPDELVVEESVPPRTVDALRQRGHPQVRTRKSIAVLQAIEWSEQRQEFLGVHDPRVPGLAEGEKSIAALPRIDENSILGLRAGDWPMEQLRLRDGRLLRGLSLAELDDEFDFAEITRAPGKAVSAVVHPLAAKDVQEFKRLPDEQRGELVERFRWIRGRASIEAARMDRVPLEERLRGGTRWWDYRGPWFELESTAGDQATRRAVVRIEQVFRAFRQLLPPRRAPQRLLRVVLLGSEEERARVFADAGLEFTGPAVYAVDSHQVIAGSDLAAFSERWSVVRQELDVQQWQFEKRRAEFPSRIANVARELRAAEFSDEKVREELRLRRKLWGDEYETAISRIQEARLGNARRFDQLARQLFQRLNHELFHAYLEDFVYPGDRYAVPRWLNEGLAQIVESSQLDDDTLRIDGPDRSRLRELRRLLMSQEYLSLTELLRANDQAFLASHDLPDSHRHYLVAWGVAYYLVFQYDLISGGFLDSYVRRGTRSIEPVARFERFVGMPLAEFEADWRSYILGLSTGP